MRGDVLSPAVCGWSIMYAGSTNAATNELFGVGIVAPDDIWAVGRSEVVEQPSQSLITHWNGTQWSVVSFTEPSVSSQLYQVGVVSANDVWAVGVHYPETAIETLVMHWNGVEWSIVKSPNAASVSDLRDIEVISANDIWAVGGYGVAPGEGGTLAIHWDGVSWTLVPVPNGAAGSALLWGVTSTSSDNVWAVGYERISVGPGQSYHQTFTVHWDGTMWNYVPSPNVDQYDQYLYKVDAVSPNDIWAVGHYGFLEGEPYHTLTLHWNGTDWSIVASPDVGNYGNFLNDVKAISRNDVWAVGQFFDLATEDDGISLHWDGVRWTSMPLPYQPEYEHPGRSRRPRKQ